ncbi:MAG: A/G-specific adenine glycosylase [Bacteroidetes bacterium]|nr:MAG: A/G-specific adenine glycosylase [Bacteroidota bacterium]
MNFAIILDKWYKNHRRDLPWRDTRDPYKVWLSEIILQQTRVEQGLPYYKAFAAKYPTVQKLAAAKEEDVLKLWQGLGYYSRARNLHAAAKQVTQEYGGKFPGTYAELLRLKGVGDYTAGAIASFCFGEAQPVVDGNVYRVLSRVFGIDTPIDSVKGKKDFRQLASELLNKKDPAGFNQAIMEFGALHCTPKKPGCLSCPFATYCEARREKLVDKLPVKAQKTKQNNRHFYYLLLFSGDFIYARKRSGKDIWQNLYDFPLVETKAALPEKKLVNGKVFAPVLGKTTYSIKHISAEIRHLLSHQKLHIRFIEMRLNKPLPLSQAKGLAKIRTTEIHKLAVPVVIHNYLLARKFI